MNQDILDIIPNEDINISNGKTIIEEHYNYLRTNFFNGIETDILIKKRSDFIDKLLIKIWNQLNLSSFSSLSLVAVGGYGRQELQPYSDIDILFVYTKESVEELNEVIPKFTTLLWDLKLEIGQSVRTIKECIEEGKKDVTIATNLLETRLLIGSKNTYNKLIKKISSPDFWSIEDFYNAKIAEQKERHHSYKDTIYMLEPDIKNTPGGIRDIHTPMWIANKLLNITSIKELVDHKLLTKLECFELLDCQSFLFKIRFALHITNNKPDNRLTFDKQKKIAEIFGYHGEDNSHVEAFMKKFYQTMHIVSELNEIIIDVLKEKIFPVNENYTKIINKHFIVKEDLIDVLDPLIFIKQQKTILELFLIVTETPSIKGIYFQCIRDLRNARRTIKNYLYENEKCREIFKKIISNTRSLTVTIPIMHKYQIISLYMPKWQEINGLMQFDMFHSYTVDEHTIRVLKNIHKFSINKKEKYPLFKEVYTQLDKPELLFIAALFHDIAKGRKGHHAELGAPEALYFCKVHKYNRYESKLVAWIVKNHLYMSLIAQRRDISDPDVITEFAKNIGDENFLNYLYCMTVADICATNETEWNSYKDSLLRTLYFATRNALRRGLENPPDLRLHVRENQQFALSILTQKNVSPIDIFKTWDKFKIEYFIRYTPQQIAWHTENIINHKNKKEPLILFGYNSQINGTELFVYTNDSNGLFAKVTSVLGTKGLNILSSIISGTNDTHALDTFIFNDRFGSPLAVDRLHNIRLSITKALAEKTIKIYKNTGISLKLKPFNHPTTVTYLSTKDNKNTQLEISTLDVPGLLANIGKIFYDNNVIITSAKITTTGERADDFFSIVNMDQTTLNDEQKEILKNELITKLDARFDNNM